MKKRLMLAVLAICLGLAGSASANLLINSGFEDDADSNGRPDNWTFDGVGYGGATSWRTYVQNDPDNAYSGDDYVDIGVNSEGSGGYAQVYQDIAVTEGVEYFYSAYASSTEIAEGETVIFKLRFEFFNDSNAKTVYQFEQAIDKDGAYHLQSESKVAPAGAVKLRACVVTPHGNNVFVDDIWVDETPRPTGAIDPSPADGAVVGSDLDVLSWTEPYPNVVGDTVTNDVWFSTDFPEYGLIAGDPNFTNYATKIVSRQDEASVTLSELIPPIEIELGQTYYWRVDCYDETQTPGDPNDPNEIFLQGEVWMFEALNQSPEVTCGLNQAVWMSAGSATVTVTADASDDGLPNPPGEITYTWSSVPAAQSIASATGTVPVDGALSTDMTFDAPGVYEITCTVDDGDAAAADTTKVFVVAEGETGVVAYWPFDADFTDASGNGHDATSQGDAQIDSVEAKVGAGCLVVDGDGDYADCGGAGTDALTWASPTPDASVMTVSLWVKSNGSFDDYRAGLFHKAGSWGIQRLNSTDNASFFLQDVGTLSSDSTQTVNTIDDGQWHHLAGVSTGDVFYFYVDGILANAAEITDPVAEGTHEVWIGKGYDASSSETTYEFNGWIDEVRLRNVPLTAEKVLEEFVNDGGSNSCGDVYLATDLNKDCYVNLEDFAILAASWLNCNDVTDPACD